MRLSTSSKRILAITVLLVAVLGSMAGYIVYLNKINEVRQDARTAGQTIAVKVQTELKNLDNTLVLLEGLYQVHGDAFLRDFNIICKRLLADELAIGSLYFAPGGVIRYSAPEEVSAYTNQYNMLEDAVQGPKSRLAAESGKSTIAGPHNLIEGGKGLILRRPVYSQNKFDAMLVSVIDINDLFVKVTESLTDTERNYHYAIYKGDDATAVFDADGYIYNNGKGKIGTDIVVSFEVPNDTWYLAIEPHTPFAFWNTMLLPLAIIGVVCLVIIGVTYIILRQYELRKQMLRDKEESIRMKKELRYQQQLQAALDEAEAANQAKTSFLFNMSHDIRTPMNAIKGFTELLDAHQDDPARRKDYLEKIKVSTGVMTGIINNVLEMAKIENGKMTLDENPYDIRHFLESLNIIFREMMTEKEIKFTQQIKMNHCYLLADTVKMHNVFDNLVNNAYKYTNRGGSVAISVEELDPERKGYATFRFEVADTGIGMAPDFLPRVFDVFEREQNFTQSKIEGAGLGLAIVKKLVELMKGEISVVSEQGKGSVFTVVLSQKIVSREEVVMDSEGITGVNADLHGIRILLAEDNKLNAEIAKTILEEEGLMVERAKNGLECVKMLTEAADDYYDMILMDIQMPKMDGYEATRTIRTLENQEKALIPIVAMTANAFAEDRIASLKAGMNGHISKPFQLEEVLHWIRILCSNKHQ